AWLRLGESYVLPPTAAAAASLVARASVGYHVYAHAHARTADRCVAALVLYGAPGPLGAVCRGCACVGGDGEGAAYERLVLEEGVERGVLRLARVGGGVDGDAGEEGEGGRRTPMRVLGGMIVRERVRAHLGDLFVAGVCHREHRDVEREEREREWRRTVEAARELGGGVGALGRRFERVWRVPGGEVGLCQEDGERDGDGVEALVDAVVLYRRVFAPGGVGTDVSALTGLSWRGRDGDGDVGRLRRALGSRVFEESAVLEDARDRVVDMVVELERRRAGVR
ncbi:hypothetical protein C0993_012793, partial [Termitomyces sp. T159_Od127]